MFCPKCGEKRNDSSKFCEQCGYKFSIEINKNERNENLKKNNQKRNRNNSKIIVVISTVFILVIVSIIVFIKNDFYKDLFNRENNNYKRDMLSENQNSSEEKESLKSNEPINDKELFVEENNNNMNNICTIVSEVGYIIGGYTEKGWTESGDMYERLNKGQTYSIHYLVESVGNFQGSKAYTEQEPVEFVKVNIDGIYENESSLYDWVGISCSWDPKPGKVIDLNPNNKIYKNITTEILDNYGIVDHNPKITQLIKTDLENDGVDEMIIVASNDINTEEIVYSFVIFRKIIDGEVVNFILKKDSSFNDPESAIYGGNSYYVPALLDCNGDGIMEILLGCCYYESISTEVYEVKNGGIQKVLSDNGFGL